MSKYSIPYYIMWNGVLQASRGRVAHGQLETTIGLSLGCFYIVVGAGASTVRELRGGSKQLKGREARVHGCGVSSWRCKFMQQGGRNILVNIHTARLEPASLEVCFGAHDAPKYSSLHGSGGRNRRTVAASSSSCHPGAFHCPSSSRSRSRAKGAIPCIKRAVRLRVSNLFSFELLKSFKGPFDDLDSFDS